jgi:hypothetical protein
VIFHLTCEVKAGPEAVFDALADVRNEVEWNALVTRADLISSGPIGAGTTFDTITRGRPFRATIATYDRPTRLGFEITGPQLGLASSFAFDAAGTSGPTTVAGDFEFLPKGLFKLAFPLLKPMIVGPMPKRMASFARFVESTQS